MSQLQSMAYCLLAAGGIPEANGDLCILYVDSDSEAAKDIGASCLIYKKLAGTKFGDSGLITTGVRPNSTAAYLVTPSGKKFIFCISEANSLRAVELVKDETEEGEESWEDNDLFGGHQVHPEGRITAAVDPDGAPMVFFQDPEGHLAYLSASFPSETPTKLPGDPAIGTPLAFIVMKGYMTVFYFSSTDHHIHYVALELPKEDSLNIANYWVDKVFHEEPFKDTPKRVVVTENKDGVVELFVLSKNNALVQVTEGGQKLIRGKVEPADGQFVPDTTEECYPVVGWPCGGGGYWPGGGCWPSGGCWPCGGYPQQGGFVQGVGQGWQGFWRGCGPCF